MGFSSFFGKLYDTGKALFQKAAGWGSNLMGKVSNIADSVSQIPIIGPALKTAYEATPIGQTVSGAFNTVKQSLDDASQTGRD